MSNDKKPSTFDLALIKNEFDKILALSGGELDEDKEKQLELVEKALAVKADAAHYVMGLMDAQGAFYKSEGKRLTQYAKTLENAKSRLKQRILDAVKVGGEIVGDTIKFGLKKNPPSLIVDDVSKLPEKYVEQVITLEVKKDDLKRDLKAGDNIPGARLVSGESLKAGRPK